MLINLRVPFVHKRHGFYPVRYIDFNGVNLAAGIQGEVESPTSCALFILLKP